MSDELNKLIIEAIPDQEKANEVIGRLFTVAQPGTIFSEPVVAGEHTVITASEVSVGMGLGYGGGGGFEPQGEGQTDQEGGLGSGGGGGGYATGRPIAAISIGPDGVRVDPIADVTKIALAFFTMLGSLILMIRKMKS